MKQGLTNLNRVKNCPVCGSRFYPEFSNQVYCCLHCQVEGRRKKRSEWYSNHPGYIKMYMRNRRLTERSIHE